MHNLRLNFRPIYSSKHSVSEKVNSKNFIYNNLSYNFQSRHYNKPLTVTVTHFFLNSTYVTLACDHRLLTLYKIMENTKVGRYVCRERNLLRK